ncbi:MAG: glycosyl transferase group 1 [Acidimicrobiales bacterium]|nr:glycosyl transferase group 1 [Acidimicrobiales bacterium]
MRLALYHPWTYLSGGIERCIVELMSRSRHDWTLYTHHYAPDTTFPELRGMAVVPLEPSVRVRRSIRPLAHAAVTMARSRLPLAGERALLISSDGLGDLVAVRNKLPTACYCHTPLKILHDPVTRDALKAQDRRKALALGLLGPAFGAVDRRVWQRYQHVFVNSSETGRRVAAAGLKPAGPVEILHPGVDVERFVPPLAARKAMFLVAGRIMWQKNIELAVKALSRVIDAGLHAEVVVAGAVDEKSGPYLERLRRACAGLPVFFEPNPTDERLLQLYQEAIALVFTPPNEDWGIVPLEAMACGTPVLAVASGGPSESVLDGRTGWLLPDDPQAFASKMADVLRADDRMLAAVRGAARARATEFGWDTFVARIDDVMEELAGLPTDGAEPEPAERVDHERAGIGPVPVAGA